MSRCVLSAISTYPFREGERGRVRLEGADFDVRGSEVLVTYVLYNLLKNALHAIASARKGEIVIRTLPGDARNLLLVRDTGSGIPPQVLPQIFEEFYSGKGAGRGTGMGLPFCRRVMRAFGGAISCRSELGEFTEMELSFPPPDDAGGPVSPVGAVSP
jgi:signal transduction histidine kinase